MIDGYSFINKIPLVQKIKITFSNFISEHVEIFTRIEPCNLFPRKSHQSRRMYITIYIHPY
jgi:hypothetical protein